jgi:transposase
MVDPEVVVRMRVLSGLGWGSKRIAVEVGVARNTVRRYLRGGPEAERQERPGRRRLSYAGRAEAEQLMAGEAGGNAVVVQELLEKRGVAASVRTVQRAVQEHRRRLRAEVLATVRFETAPGEQMQADLGKKRMRIGGERVMVIFFVAVLGYSRRIFVKLLGSERQEEWLAALAGAFGHFDGVPRSLLVDNAGPLVVRHDVQRRVVRLTEGFAAFCRDWEVVPKVCRPYRARTKGKTESGVGFVKKNGLAERSFESVEELQEHLASWCLAADERIHGTTGERPVDRYERIEATALQPLPKRILPARERRLRRRVATDCFVDVDAVRYSVPHRLVKESVEVLVLEEAVVVFHGGSEVARHRRSLQPRARVIDPAHYDGLWRPWEKVAESVSLETVFPGRSLADYEAVVAGGRG